MARSLVRLAGSLLIPAILVLSSGCATHAPMSEMVMFHDAAHTWPAHDASRGYGLVLTGRAGPQRSTLEAWAEREQNGMAQPAAELYDVWGLSVGYYRTVYIVGAGTSMTAGSFTAGLGVAGGDATTRLWRRNYLTLSGGFGGFQALLQHRAYNGAHVGAAVGLGYRYENYIFGIHDEADPPHGMVPGLEAAGIHLAGLRAMFFHRPDPSYSGGLRASLFVGYAPEFGQASVSVNLSTGRF